MPNVGYKSVGFTMPTGGSFPRNLTITLAGGLGKTPKAALIYLSGATALDTISATARVSVGITDGTNQRCCAIVMEDAAVASGNGDSGFRTDTASLIQMPDNGGGGGLQVSATFVSFGTDSITINVDVDGGAFLGEATLFYGDDLRAHVTSLTSHASNGGQVSTTAPGWRPDCLLTWSVAKAFSSLNSGSGAMMSFGFASRTPAGQNACSTVVYEDNAASASASGCITRDDNAIAVLSCSGGTVTEGTRLAMSCDATGYTAQTANTSGAIDFMVLALDLGGSQTTAFVATIVSSSIGNHGSSFTGFQPRALFASATVVGAVNTVGSTRGSLSMGLAQTTESVCVSVLSQDAQVGTIAKSLVSSANFVDLMLTATTHDWIASLVSFDAAGWTLNVPDASAADRPTAFLAIEGPRQFSNSAISETVSITETSPFVKSSLQLGETVNISETSQFVSKTLQLGETVSISETSPFVKSSLQLGETVTVSEVSSLVVTSDVLRANETVSISENSLLVTASLRADETVTISETSAFVVTSDFLRADETVAISETSLLVSATLQLDETVTISETASFVVTSNVLRADETVTISETFLLEEPSLQIGETVAISEVSSFVVTSDVLRADETVTISETSSLIVGLAAFVADETVTISETSLFNNSTAMNNLIANETVTISETSAFQAVDLLQANETVSISENSLFVSKTIQIDETVTIGDGFVFAGTGVAVSVNETVGISEGASFVSGTTLIANETVTIGDGFSFGAGTVPRKASYKGETVEGG